MSKKSYVLLALCILVSGCASFTQCDKIPTSGKGQPPVILDSYAPSQIRPGTTWRVYLRAKDPDGDMKEMIQALMREGSSPLNTAFTQIKVEHSAEMDGYIFLRTPSTVEADYNRLGFMGLTLRITLRDCQGNKSADVEFPLNFTLEPAQAQDLPSEWQDVADISLGAIMIDLGDMLNRGRGSN